MLRELDRRRNGWIDVTLFWDDSFHRTLISLKDDRGDLKELFAVPAHHAMDALEHPFYYLHREEV